MRWPSRARTVRTKNKKSETNVSFGRRGVRPCESAGTGKPEGSVSGGFLFSTLNFNVTMTPKEILKVEKEIVLTLKNIYDPEIPVNIYDLGLIYEIDYTPDGVANIRMTLTAPNCPMADMLVEDVNQQVAKVKGVKSVNVILTFDPVWDKSMMSEEALLELNLF